MFGAGTQDATSPDVSSINRIAAARRTGTVRAALLGGASVLALAAVALPRAALAQDQTINTATAGPVAANGSAITVTVAGAVSGAANGITYGAITTLSNQGLISGTSQGVAGNGSIATLSNQGTIFGSSIAIANAGTIGSAANSGGSIWGGNAGVSNAGSIGTLSNSGAIYSTSSAYSGLGAITNAAGATIDALNNSGTISAWLTGVGNAGTIGTLTNSGALISASPIPGQNGLVALANQSTGLILTLSNSGTIAGSLAGVSNTGSLGSLVNGVNGSIWGTRAGILNASGASASVAIGTLTNDGTISAARAGLANQNGIGALSNSAGAVVDGNRFGILNSGYYATIGVLNNAGTISSNSGAALSNADPASIGALTNSGKISGANTGIANSGTITTLTNSGTIGGHGGGIQNGGGIGTLSNAAGGVIGGGVGINNSAAIGAMSNAGRISGSTTGISNSGSIGPLTNSGTISGGSYAINSTGSIGVITNTGVINGNIAISGQSGVQFRGGTGSVFGTLTGGTITDSTGINLVNFGGGNIHLDDDIGGGGVTVLVNNSGFLQLANSHTITGGFSQGLFGVLDIQAGGTAAGDYGSLTASGIANFHGGLAFDLIDGFTLTPGDGFDIFNFASSTGDFTSFAFDGISCSAGGSDVWSCGNWTFTEVFQGGTQLWLDVSAESVPEPAALGLFAPALAALAFLRRRRA